MERIQGPTATVDNLFTEGNPSLNIPATIVSGVWLNAAQEEIAQSVERGAIALNGSKENQIGDFITEYSRPFNLLLGFNTFTQKSTNLALTPAINDDQISATWLFQNGLAAGSPNAVNANIYINPISGCLEIEGIANIGDYFLIVNTDPFIFDVGQNHMTDPAFNQRGSAAPLPNETMTKSALCTVYGGAVPVEFSLVTADGVIYDKIQNVNNGETRQAVTIQQNAANYGNFNLKVKLLQTGAFKVNLGGFCAFWGANKFPPFTLEAPYGAKLIHAARSYQSGVQGVHYLPAKFTAGIGASNAAKGFCAFNSEMRSTSQNISATGLTVISRNNTGVDVPAAAASIVIGTVYKNGFEYTVFDNLTSAFTFLEIKFNWEAWFV